MRAVHADAVVTGDAATSFATGRGRRRRAARSSTSGPPARCSRGTPARPSSACAACCSRGSSTPTRTSSSARMRGQVRGGAGFVPWVEQLIGVRAEARPEDDSEAIERAVAELDAFGTAAVGEVTQLARRRASRWRGAASSGCVFHEVFGVERGAARAARRRSAAGSSRRPSASGRRPDLAYAPTPHTLYTTHPDVVRRLAREARERGARISLHLAEHAAERRFLEHGDGPIAGVVRDAPQAAARSARVAGQVAHRASPTSSARSAPTSSACT